MPRERVYRRSQKSRTSDWKLNLHTAISSLHAPTLPAQMATHRPIGGSNGGSPRLAGELELSCLSFSLLTSGTRSFTSRVEPAL